MLKRRAGVSATTGARGWAVVAWLAVASAAALSGGDLAICGVTAVAGSVLAIAGRRLPILGFAPVVVGAIGGAEVLPWAIAGTALTLRPAPETVRTRLDGELHRQLMRSRRREEPAEILVVGAAGVKALRDELIATLRATDGLELVAGTSGVELRAVLDGRDIDRGAVERRLRAAAGESAALRFGWASFPADGVTLDTLLTVARTTARTAHVRPQPAATSARFTAPGAGSFDLLTPTPETPQGHRDHA